MLPLEILYQDTQIIAINKPNGLLVHRTKIAEEQNEFALQMLRDQIGQRVFPIHRLDRKTSGVLLFGLNPEIVKAMQEQIENQTVTKKYLAIVRGWLVENIKVNHPLTNDRGKKQEALTHFLPIEKTELNIPFGKHETSRYSLVEAYPKTGRQHQIRKHLNHLRHPIIGDRPHGCNKQNKLFKEKWQLTTMLLHAQAFTFSHPDSKEKIKIVADLPEAFLRMIKTLEFSYLAN